MYPVVHSETAVLAAHQERGLVPQKWISQGRSVNRKHTHSLTRCPDFSIWSFLFLSFFCLISFKNDAPYIFLLQPSSKALERKRPQEARAAPTREEPPAVCPGRRLSSLASCSHPQGLPAEVCALCVRSCRFLCLLAPCGLVEICAEEPAGGRGLWSREPLAGRGPQSITGCGWKSFLER